jgi:hypothetical protein
MAFRPTVGTLCVVQVLPALEVASTTGAEVGPVTPSAKQAFAVPHETPDSELGAGSGTEALGRHVGAGVVAEAIDGNKNNIPARSTASAARLSVRPTRVDEWNS